MKIGDVEVRVPGGEGRTAEVLEDHDRIVIVAIGHDDNGNQLEDQDGLGTIRSFNIRHANSVRSREEADELRSRPDAVLLSYFEHGRCLWGVRGSMSAIPDFQWDGVGMAGVWLPDKYLTEELDKLPTEDRRQRAEEFAEQACKLYTSWCNGDVYWARVTVYSLLRDTDGAVIDAVEHYDTNAEPTFEMHAHGIYGWEDIEGVVLDMLTEAVKAPTS